MDVYHAYLTELGVPLPPLRPYVERYCGYRMAGFPAGLHPGLGGLPLGVRTHLAGLALGGRLHRGRLGAGPQVVLRQLGERVMERLVGAAGLALALEHLVPRETLALPGIREGLVVVIEQIAHAASLVARCFAQINAGWRPAGCVRSR